MATTSPGTRTRAARAGHTGSSPASSRVAAKQQALRRHASASPFGLVQARLTVGNPGDRYEAEAERVADQVMRAQDVAVPSRATAPPFISRIAGAGNEKQAFQMTPRETGDRVQRQAAAAGAEEEELVQTSAATTPTGARRDDADELVAGVCRAPGRPLPPELRDFMEPRFGADFGQVRLHDGRGADEAARAINARAFTMGHHIVLASGEGAVDVPQGRRLLAHELTHVVQQTGRGDAGGRNAPDAPGHAPAVSADTPAGGVARRVDHEAFQPVATVTQEWTAQLWDTLFINEHLADLNVTSTNGVDSAGRRQVWGVRASATKYANLIDIGKYAETTRVGNAMDLYFEFSLAGPTVQITNSIAHQSGVSAGVETGGVTIGFTSGTTVTQSYQTSGPGASAIVSRRVRFSGPASSGSAPTIQSQDIPSSFYIEDAEGHTLYGDIETQHERWRTLATT